MNARRNRVESAHKETGQWLQHDSAYMSWNSDRSSGLLLIRGKPGSGKSTLAKSILNSLHLQHSYTKNSNEGIINPRRDILIADFFYSFRGGKTEVSHRLMLQSLLYQLLSQDEGLYPLFRDIFRARRIDVNQHPWEWDDLRRILASLGSYKGCENIYILVDGMDESDQRGRPEILQLLIELCSPKSECTIKALIATRPLPPGELDERLNYCHLIILQERNSKDIMNVVNSGIQAIKDMPDAPLIDFTFVKDYIMENADGVFLWVALIITELKDFVKAGCSQVELEACLQSLPTELEDMYSLIIHRPFDSSELQHKSPARKNSRINQTVKMLNWVTFAHRPLSSKEFQDAIAMPSNSEHFVPGVAFLRQNRIEGIDNRIRSYCGNLLEIRGSVVQLVHQTARDYLLQKNKAAAPFDMDEMRGDTAISSACVRYLRLLATQPRLKEVGKWDTADYDEFVKQLTGFPLLEYVVSSLPRHMESIIGTSQFDEDLSSFLQSLEGDKLLSYFFESWTKRCLRQQGQDQLDSQASCFRTESLIAAAGNGYVEVVKVLKCLDTDINGIGRNSHTFALYAAAKNGHQLMVQAILEMGADVNTQGGQYGTALQVASAKGHQAVVDLLLERGADVNAQGGDYGNALQAASAKGLLDIVNLLLQKGADVNAQSGDYGNAHRAASANGLLAIVDLLSQRGADVNAQGGYYGNALQVASAEGHQAIVELLLQKGADVNAQGGDYGNALRAASAKGHQAIVELLLQNGADPDANGRHDGHAIQVASVGQRQAIVGMLPQNGNTSGPEEEEEEYSGDDLEARPHKRQRR